MTGLADINNPGFGALGSTYYTNYSVYAPQHEVDALRRRIVALETDNVRLSETIEKLENYLDIELREEEIIKTDVRYYKKK